MFKSGDRKKVTYFAERLIEGDYMVPFKEKVISNQYKKVAQCMDHLRNQLLEYTFET